MRGQAAHPDAEVLAEFRAGLIGGMRGRRLAAHVTGCSRCAVTDARLAEISSALASVPTPPLPDQVAARIGMALAAEASARAAAGPAAAAADHAADGAGNGQHVAAPSGGGRRGPGRRRASPGRLPRPLRPAILVPAAAVCALLAAGGGFLLSRTGTPSGQSAASRAVNGTAVGMKPHNGSAQVLPYHVSPKTPTGSPGTGTNGGSSAGTSVGPSMAAGAPSVGMVPVISSGTDYQPATLPSQIETTLQKPRRGAPLASPALRGCALKVTGRTSPLFVDHARYQSRPAYVIVTRLRAWVVGNGCTAASPDVITSVPLRLVGTGAGIFAP